VFGDITSVLRMVRVKEDTLKDEKVSVLVTGRLYALTRRGWSDFYGYVWVLCKFSIVSQFLSRRPYYSHDFIIHWHIYRHTKFITTYPYLL
jgi:hypothetical protein